MPGQDFVSPGDDGVDDFAELGKLAGGVEIPEPSQRGECAVVVLGRQTRVVGVVADTIGALVHRGEPCCEPADDMEPVQDVAGVGYPGVDGGLICSGPVGDDNFDTPPPSGGLLSEKAC